MFLSPIVKDSSISHLVDEITLIFDIVTVLKSTHMRPENDNRYLAFCLPFFGQEFRFAEILGHRSSDMPLGCNDVSHVGSTRVYTF